MKKMTIQDTLIDEGLLKEAENQARREHAFISSLVDKMKKLPKWRSFSLLGWRLLLCRNKPSA